MKDVKQVMISKVERSSSVVRPEAVLVTLKQLNILLMITSFVSMTCTDVHSFVVSFQPKAN
jgi:hypothetical protein